MFCQLSSSDLYILHITCNDGQILSLTDSNNVTEAEKSSCQESLANGTSHPTVCDDMPADKAETNGHRHLTYTNQVKVTSWPTSATEVS